MFTRRFFNPRYFALRYWPKVGSGEPIPPRPTALSGQVVPLGPDPARTAPVPLGPDPRRTRTEDR